MYQGLAISDLILDVLVLVLPIPMVISLKLPWKAKIKVIDILLLGGVYVAFDSSVDWNKVADNEAESWPLVLLGSPLFFKSLLSPTKTQRYTSKIRYVGYFVPWPLKTSDHI